MKSEAELNAIKQGVLDRINSEKNDKIITSRHVLVCGNTDCASPGCASIVSELNIRIKEHNIKNVHVTPTGCLGTCSLNPIILIYPDKTFYAKVKLQDIEHIVKEHLLEGNVVQRLLGKDDINPDAIKFMDEIVFFKHQCRRVLKNCGIIDPENIDEYIGFDGYAALTKALKKTPQQVIDIIKESGLRGRGGEGFPTGVKWDLIPKDYEGQKYIICNANEGDHTSFIAKTILESDPQSVIEAMIIAGYAVGATKGYIYLPERYSTALERLTTAIGQARAYELLGDDIFNSGFNFGIEIRIGQEAFICGEETALIASIEGKRAEPRSRPPFPTTFGLWQQPTLVNNVETFANITGVINNGVEWFSSVGTKSSKGTKIFALGGKVKNAGLIEVAFGTTLREIVETIGGGVPESKVFKAVQIGGFSGGCIPYSLIDEPLDYEMLNENCSMIGSGGFIVLNEDTCMVDIAKFFLEFSVGESCGKCVPCRIGTKRMLEILEKISQGGGMLEDLDNLKMLANVIKKTSLCGLGQTAPNIVLSTIKYFENEYIAHIVQKRCPAGVCRALLKYEINKDKCIGCGICAKNCPEECIKDNHNVEYNIDQDRCVKCGVCHTKCPPKIGAISKI